MKLEWEPPIVDSQVSDDVDGYVLHINPDDKTTETLRLSSTEYNLVGLAPASKYHIILAAYNQYGEGDSVALQQMTDSQAPSAPTINRVTYTSPSSAVVTWTEPQHQYNLVDSYTISWREISVPDVWFESSVIGSSDYFDLENLVFQARYEVTIKAITNSQVNDGITFAGPASDPVYYKHVLPPPLDFSSRDVSISGMRLTWKLPYSNGSIPRDIDGYRLYVFKAIDSQYFMTKDITIPISTRGYYLSGLDQATVYNVTLVLYNLYGEGDPATLQQITAKGRKEFILEVKRVTAYSMLLEWNLNPNRFDGFILHVYNADTVLNVTLPINAREYQVTDLEPATSYIVALIAFGEDVERKSATKMGTTDSAVPGVPRDVRVLFVSQNSAMVTWTAPLSKRYEGHAYTVSYRWTGEPDMWQEISTTEPSRLIIVNLNYGAQYEVTVTDRVYNFLYGSTYESPASAPVEYVHEIP
ncbi:tenascin-R-like [Ptychodera flava]|uniref:tenascin-R-like n=1 Tax=Ptychodera flava TaxID=63121 RepID=UPI003969FF43